MQRESVHEVIALLQNLAVPFEVSAHARTARAAGDQFDRKDQPLASGAPHPGPSGHIRLRIRGRSASRHPSHCPGTSASRCTARGSRACGAGRSIRVPLPILQYSTSAAACSGVPVPRLTAIRGCVPTALHHVMNSFVPKRLESSVFQALSSTVGRSCWGPTPSSQL